MDYKQGMRCLKLAALILGLSQVQPALGKSVVSLPPSDMVQRVGEDVQFFCKIAGIPEKEAVIWSRVTHASGKEELIFKTFEPEELNKVKYNFTKTAPLETNIVVKDLTMDDAGIYDCAPMTDHTLGKTAELVVVDDPMSSVPEGLEDGKAATLSCGIYYISSKDSALAPELFAMIGTKSLPIDNVNSGELDGKYWKRLEYEETFVASQHGENFTCGARVIRNSPTPIDFTISTIKELQIQYATTKVDVTEPVQEMYYPGDSIICTGDGYPEPTLSWIPIESDGAAEINGPTLIVTEQMVGKNIWKCKGTQSGTQGVESAEISFQVLPPTEPPIGQSTGADGTTIGVAVGVSVVLLVGVVVIVIFFLCKKRRAARAAAQPKRTQSIEERAETGTASQRSQKYIPVAINPEGEVVFQEEKASSRREDPTNLSGKQTAELHDFGRGDMSGRPIVAPRDTEQGRATEI